MTSQKKQSMHLTEQLRLQMLEDFRHDPDVVWTPEVAAAYLAVAPTTLKRWRRTGEGPRFTRYNGKKVGYRRSVLDAWLKSREAQSTSAEATADSGSAPEAGA